jgi:hypothetical protein
MHRPCHASLPGNNLASFSLRRVWVIATHSFLRSCRKFMNKGLLQQEVASHKQVLRRRPYVRARPWHGRLVYRIQHVRFRVPALLAMASVYVCMYVALNSHVSCMLHQYSLQYTLYWAFLTFLCMYVCSPDQCSGGGLGLVVISRSGSNPEKCMYEDDTLSSLKVHLLNSCTYM